jgi:hypothetical protein
MNGGTLFAHGIMCRMDEFDERLVAAAKKRTRAKEAFDRADAEVRALLVEGRNEHDKGPSYMAKLTGFTREWVAKIAPDPEKAQDDTPKKRVVRVPRRKPASED